MSEIERRVLLVDRERLTRAALALELRTAGIDFVAVENTNDGLAHLSSGIFDLVIVDISRGVDELERIRRHSGRLRLLAITSRPSVPFAISAVRLGALDVYAKPLQVRLVAKWLSTSALGIPVAPASNRFLTLEEVEKDYIERVLVEAEGNVSLCARWLGIHRRSLQRKLDRMWS